jgi:hypothetical protein
MIHVTIFGGHEGRLQPNKRFYLTLFGGCGLVRPTVARQLLAQRQAERENRARGKTFFLTAFGAAEIKAPTLTEEFLDLREMINSGMLNLDDWERSMAELARSEGLIASFTIFGGFDECTLPKEDEEIDSLAVQRHLGNIPESAGHVLQFGIGQRGAERTATLRRAILAAAG